MEVKLKQITPNAEVNIVEIARVSSSREDKKADPDKLINYLIKNKHWSPFEHSYLTFEIKTTKAIGIQLLRHRSFTFQELSQRYAEIEGYEFPEIRRQAEKDRQSSTEVFEPMIKDPISGEEYDAGSAISAYLQQGEHLYKELIRAGVAKECARMILPMCTETIIYMTGSVRSWIHFLDIRDDSHTQKECQSVAKEIKKIFVKELPIISKVLGYDISQ